MPLNIIVDLSSYCQLSCPFCRTGNALRDHYPQVPRGMMSRSTFKNILFKLPPIGTMLLYNWGEPFLNPDILWFIMFGKKMANKCILSTNMHIMSEHLAEGIVRSHTDTVFVSCDGITQQSYEAYRTGGKLDLVLKNARLLADTKERLGSIYPEIVFQCIVNKFNEHEVDRYEEFAKSHGADRVRFIPLCGLTPEGHEIQADFAPESAEWMPFQNWGRVRDCSEPWTNMVFDWNGDVYTCCNPAGLQEYCMGNINQSTFEEIWTGPKYEYVKRFCKSASPEDNGQKIMCHACYGVFPSEESFRNDFWRTVFLENER